MFRSIINVSDDETLRLTSAWLQDGVPAEVSDFHHHAVVDHTVGGFEATMDPNITGVKI